MQKLLKPEEAAPYLGVAPGTLANWRVSGSGPKYLKVASKVLYDPADIVAWRDARRVASTSEQVAA